MLAGWRVESDWSFFVQVYYLYNSIRYDFLRAPRQCLKFLYNWLTGLTSMCIKHPALNRQLQFRAFSLCFYYGFPLCNQSSNVVCQQRTQPYACRFWRWILPSIFKRLASAGNLTGTWWGQLQLYLAARVGCVAGSLVHWWLTEYLELTALIAAWACNGL